MKLYLKNIADKIKYNSPIRIVLDGLRHIGLTFMPFYIFNEDVKARMSVNDLALPDDFTIATLNETDMKEMEQLPMRTRKESALLNLMRKGSHCLGIRINGQLAAFIWYSQQEFSFSGFSFAMAHNEAYLFDAYTSPDFRGMNLAPLIRQEGYKVLDEQGITTLLSVSECFNRASIGSMTKRKVPKECLLVYLSLFKKFDFVKPVKLYQGKSRLI